jgi:hypothetical protein
MRMQNGAIILEDSLAVSLKIKQWAGDVAQ